MRKREKLEDLSKKEILRMKVAMENMTTEEEKEKLLKNYARIFGWSKKTKEQIRKLIDDPSFTLKLMNEKKS
jgi:hypothetical protein